MVLIFHESQDLINKIGNLCNEYMKSPKSQKAVYTSHLPHFAHKNF